MTTLAPLDPLSVPLEGIHLIEASAGTGKTYTIHTLFLRLLIERGLTIDQLLVVTFTRAATAELRSRVRDRLCEALSVFEMGASEIGRVRDPFLAALLARNASDAPRIRQRLSEAIRDFDLSHIHTIHGFCQRVLLEHAFEGEVHFDAALSTDGGELFREIACDFWARQTYDAPNWRVRALAQRKVTPAGLTRLIRLVAGNPDLPVLPQPEDADPSAERVAFAQAWEAAAAAWRTSHAEVTTLLTTSKVLNRNRYRKTSVPQWLAAMDALMAAPPPGAALFDRFDRFTPAVLAASTKKRMTPPSHPFFERCAALLSAAEALRAALDSHVIAFQHELLDYAARELERRKRQRGTLSFDDLLLRMRAALRGPGGPALAALISGRFSAALIDEFQDTDPVQYEIFHHLFARVPAPSLFLIGDPKQAIYAFRGADVFAYLGAVDDAEHRWTLTVNWRSDPELVASVNTLFTRCRRPFRLEGIDYPRVAHAPEASERLRRGDASPPSVVVSLVARGERPTDRAGRLTKGWAWDALPALIAADVCRFLHSGATIEGRPVVPGDLAILVRKRTQALAMQEALRRLRVPSVLHTDANVLDTTEASDLAFVLRAMAEPGNARAVRQALATTLLGLDARALGRLQEDEAAWDAWISRFHAWREAWSRWGFIQAFWSCLEDQRIQVRLLSHADGERRLTNLLHLSELLHMAASRLGLGMNGLVQWLEQMRADPTTRSSLAREGGLLRLESDERALQLVTMHKSKGLEYPVVWCPYLWDGLLLHAGDRERVRFHDPEDGHRLKLDLGSDQRQERVALAEDEAAAEGMRLLYVALTRARHQVRVVWGGFADAATSPLGALLHPRDTPEDTSRWLSKATDDDLIADLAPLTASGAIAITPLEDTPGQRWSGPRVDPRGLQPRRVTESLRDDWCMSSFSSLIRSDDFHGRDHDAHVPAEEPTPPAPGAQVRLDAFHRGPQAGTLLHHILEHMDFQRSADDTVRPLVESSLRLFGLPVEEWSDLLTAALPDIVSAPLRSGDHPHGQLCLADLPPGQRINEMAFLFPVGADSAPSFSAEDLARPFAEHPSAAIPTGYAQTIADIGFRTVHGFMHGFIDLVFVHRDRWYVVDHKSNHLGPSPGDYRPGALTHAMVEHNYLLQYHLYVVALHRYLAARMPGYRYETHMGGVFYTFLRGMAPEHGAGNGVFFDRPPAAMIQALSDALERPGGART